MALLEQKDLVALAKIAVNADPKAAVSYSFGNEKFSYDDVNETLREQLNEMVGSYGAWRENHNRFFALIETLVDDVLPRKVNEAYSQFAEIKNFAQGDKPIFTQRITAASRRRAKQFITKVGLAGKYEVFKLDGKGYEVPTSAFGGAAQIGIEELLDGRFTMNDFLDIIMEGLDEAIYLEIERALVAGVEQLPETNKVTGAGFDEEQMDRLLSIVDAYGQATVYCTYEFAATMVPSEGWISDDMRNQKWNNGYLANYKGHRVIVLPQSYEVDNKTKVIDPSYAWIIPTGAEKPVKIAFEGNTMVDEWKNHDWSRDIQAYKKVGVAAIMNPNIAVYQNTDLAKVDSDMTIGD